MASMQHMARIRQLKRDIKSQRGCKKCGERRFWVLVFHHRDKESKKFKLANAERDKSGYIRNNEILEEIAKCDVYCMNCHADLHYWKEIDHGS